MNRQLEEIKETFTEIFDIDAFLATLRFYYNNIPITCLNDIPGGNIEGVIRMEVEFTGGWFLLLFGIFFIFSAIHN